MLGKHDGEPPERGESQGIDAPWFSRNRKPDRRRVGNVYTLNRSYAQRLEVEDKKGFAAHLF